ncbi:hypothetical protein D5R81_20070 [Parashewanella spongiae]|uniref:Transposase IS4-like domain-containing protein n=2 Tax=Parashewanella spongiae TaxID=342950 RepID=A0A3A6SZ92_9GAMM|nr:transposase [Parashewanella spongiae]RJY00834.1 hypothetical protein D5R81_20070 [Parashewanella spongiae]
MDLFAENNLSCLLESRLKERYQILIKEHLNVAPKLAQGVKALSHHESAWSNTQGAWRFFSNDNVTFPALSLPLLQSARQELASSHSSYGLVAHDWCRNNYLKHDSKLDKTQMSHEKDVGYELFASLLLDSDTGQPIAPLGLDLKTEKGTYRCRDFEYQKTQPHLEQLVERIEWQDNLPLDKTLVHIVDREADSAQHLRQLMGTQWLTRGKKNSTVKYGEEFISLEKLANRIDSDVHGIVDFKGKDAYLFVGEAEVILQRKSEGEVKNAPTVRFVVSTLCNDKGEQLAQWLLLSNVKEVSALTLGNWYYWRWSIESWFKVLKGHGFQLEHWQQETADRIFRRLIVSSMACVLVWKLYNDESSGAKELKTFMIKLSGRLTKRSKPVTHPALLAGLWVFLQLMEMLNNYSTEEIEMYRELASSFFGQPV